jgi:hypothetical protein
MKLLRYFLTPFLCFVLCGKALAWHECELAYTNTGAFIQDYIQEKEASLVFIGKLTSQTQWRLLFWENEKERHDFVDESGRHLGPMMRKHTFKVLKVLKGNPLEEEIVIASHEPGDGEEPHFQVGKIHKIYTLDGVDFVFNYATICFLMAFPLPDDIHGATK